MPAKYADARNEIKLVLDRFGAVSSITTRVVSVDIGVCHSMVWCTVHEEVMQLFYLQSNYYYPYHLNICKVDTSDENAESAFSCIKVTHRSGLVYQKSHFQHLEWICLSWEQSPFNCPGKCQKRFCINVWANIVFYRLVGSYLLPGHFTSVQYRVFLK